MSAEDFLARLAALIGDRAFEDALAFAHEFGGECVPTMNAVDRERTAALMEVASTAVDSAAWFEGASSSAESA